MKKTCYLSVLAALASLLFIILSGPSSAFAADVVSGSGIKIASGSPITYVRVNYATEEIRVNSAKKLYYGTLKKASDETIKASDLVEAAEDPASPGSYLIDISTLSPGKAAYIGLAETNIPKAGEKTVPAVCIPVSATQKKLVFNIAWGQEGETARQYNILNSVIVTEYSGQVVTYDRQAVTDTDEHKYLTPANINIEIRKGTNCEWESLYELTPARWASMINSGAIFYLRIAARNDSAELPGQRVSKEVKIKIAITKPSDLKIDTTKLTVNLKNGTQFKLADASNVNAWKTILPYSANSTTASALRPVSMTAVLFDPYKESTKEKCTYLSIDEIRTALGGAAAASGGAITILTRTAATTKKPAARPSALVLPAQAGAPQATLTKTPSGYLVGTITKAAGDNDDPGYEYFICLDTDYKQGAIDFAQIKWSSVRSGSELTNGLKCSYSTRSGQRREVYMNTTGAVLLIRRKGVAFSSKKEGMLASREARITIP